MIKVYKFDKDEMQGYVDDKLIQATRHPSLPLTIYNYTKLCQYSRAWDSYTIAARGLVLDDDFNVVARGYDKFFNYGELDGLGIEINMNHPHEIVEKLDGQYICLFHFGGEWVVMSRGSFTSPFAEKARELLPKDIWWSTTLNYIFELIWSEERIVVDYGGVDRLVLTGITHADNDSHIELHSNYKEFDDTAKVFDELNGKSIEELFAQDDKKSEGFVVNILNQNGTIKNRFKIKFDDYVRLHSVMTGLSARNIWEDMIANNCQLSESLLATIPDEMYDWVHQISSLLKFDAAVHYVYIIEYYNDIVKNISNENFDRDFAIRNKKNTPKEYQGLVFFLKRNDLTYNNIITNILKSLGRPGPNIMFGDKLMY